MMTTAINIFPGIAVGKSFQILGSDVMIETTSDKNLKSLVSTRNQFKP